MAQTITCPAPQSKGPYAIARNSIVTLSVSSGGSAYIAYAVQPITQQSVWKTWPQGIVTTPAGLQDVAENNYLATVTCTAGSATLQISDPDLVNASPFNDWKSQTEFPNINSLVAGFVATNNGSTISWAVGGTSGSSLPAMGSSTANEFLTNNGTTASWSTTPTELPAMGSSTANEFLSNNGTTSLWNTTASGIPAAGTSNAYQVLTVNSSGTVVWSANSLWTLASEGMQGQVKFGASAHVGRANVFPYSSGTYPVPQCNALGFMSYRDENMWPYLQSTVTAPFNWASSGIAALSSTFADFESSGINICWNTVIALDGIGGATIPYTTVTMLAALSSYAHELAAHYNASSNGLKVRLSLGSEWNVAASNVSPSDYLKMLTTTYAAVKSVTSTILVGAPVGVDLDFTGGYTAWIDAFLSTAAWSRNCDFFDHHIYDDSAGASAQLTPEETLFHCEKIHNKVLRSNPTIPICISETGWMTSTNAFKISEDTQAQYYSRWPFLLRSLPNVESVQFYELKDHDNLGFGLIRGDDTLRLAYSSVANALSFAQYCARASRYVHANNRSICVAFGYSANYIGGNSYAMWDTVGPIFMPCEIVCGAGTAPLVLFVYSVTSNAYTTTMPVATGSQTVYIPIGLSAVVAQVFDNTGALINWHITGMK